MIVGNPPYSVGQKSGNDNNQNVSYPNLDKAVMDTYAAQSGATLRRSLYDSYIKAFRWATDRIEENGIIGFVTNGQFIDASTLCGLRKSLVSEFNSIYCFNLRGDQRTQGELSRKEGGKIFGSGSRTPVAITILLKKKGVKKDGFVRYYDIGDYLTRQQKLDKVKEFDNVSQIGWKIITPDINGDWVNLRNPQYMNFFPIGERRKESEISYFSDNFSTGMVTSRDAWLYSFDYKSNNAESMISFFNQEQQRCELLFEKMLGENKLSKNQRAKEAFFENNRSEGVTRIPTLAHFVDYVRIGRELADLHLKYEKPVSAEELGVTIEMHKEDYTVVDRMRFGKGKDKSIIEYNPYITIRNIPAEAYNYIVNGKSAIEWILEQYAVTTDKASGIVNDPNTYAGGKYIFDLLLSIISVSLKTQELIAQLPEYKEI